MVESSSSSLKVEPLKATHLSWLQATDQAALLPRLQTCLFRGWISRAESLLPGVLISRQPLALVASEHEQIRSLLVIRPHNREGSCWRLELQQLTSPTEHSQGQIIRELIKLALLGAHTRSRSWILRCNETDSILLAVLRELGFQPIRSFCRWRSPATPSDHDPTAWPDVSRWVAIDRRSASLVWPLDQASTTSHQRQIVDRRPEDLLDQRGPGTGILLSASEETSGSSRAVAIAALVRQQRCDEALVLELLREPAWDERLDQGLAFMLATVAKDHPQATLICNSEDTTAKERINALGWQQLDNGLLLGRSLWRRQASPRRLQATRPLESMLGRLQPQRPPLPTPSSARVE
ncbi:MAG: hypothetical protein CBD47_04905 [Synechococcus sp. TMED187]|uniref:hypothetical protein n=1 Tax=unclassified Synechococcus TaxID=2626047 RepID=UPI000B70CA20|nr:hypothetical protein [Synechococcus sp. UW105]MAS26670.1 hypothetical protein [Synechococcus sp. NAT40]OUW47252.1 MAG: hypothetical protein CBD47_04905 [Synechococcus sp. TMED187]RZO13990.1 MAG: hypothetical protein EVB08_04120 [Synechococcus sp. MED-G135]